MICAIIAIIIIVAEPIQAIEPTGNSIIKDIEFQSFDGAARLQIETNEHVDYIIYELEDPYRIVIDPLDAVWCDFEEAVYFEEGMIRSIKFVKGREIPEGPGLPYYPFDFVAVELIHPYPYKLSENEYIITLNIGEEKVPEVKIEERRDYAKMIEEELAKDLTRKEALLEDKEKALQEEEILKEEKTKLEEAERKIEKEKEDIDLTKDELAKKRDTLEKEKLELAQEKARMEKEKRELEERKKELKRPKKLEPRPAKEILEKPPAEYLGKALTLDECIEIAMSNSLSIKISKERIKLAKLRVNEAFRELFPEVAFTLDESKGMISEQHYVGRKLGFEFKQVIFHGGEQMYLWEQSKVNLKVAEENLNKAKEDLIFDVTKAYYELAKAMNKYNFQKTLLEDINADFEMAKKEHEFGLMARIDFMNVESTINQTLHMLLTYENSLSLAKLELNKVMKIDMDADIKIDSNLELKEIEMDLGECTELALKFRPEYRISYLNTEVTELKEKLAKSQTFPQIDVFARYLKAGELLEPTFDSLDNRLKNERILGATVSLPLGPHTFDYQRKIVKLAPTVTTFESDTKSDTHKFRLNLFDNMARASEIKDATINYKQALDELIKAEQDIQTDIRGALFSFRETRLKIEYATNNIGLYNKEVEVARIRKGMNEVSLIELLDAKIKLYAEKGNHTDALGDYYIAIARVNKAIGLGGYFH